MANDPTPATELLTRSVTEVFNEGDAGRRAALIGEIYAAGIVFHDPEGTVTGRDAFGAAVAKLLEGGPGLEFTLRGPVRKSVGLGVADWQLAPPGQPPVVTGTDVALIEDGRIATMWTMLDA